MDIEYFKIEVIILFKHITNNLYKLYCTVENATMNIQITSASAFKSDPLAHGLTAYSQTAFPNNKLCINTVVIGQPCLQATTQDNFIWRKPFVVSLKGTSLV